MNIAILGAGAWGTALAVALAGKHNITLWGRNPMHIGELRTTRINHRYLPAIRLPDNLLLQTDLKATLNAADLLLIATSTEGLTPTLEQVACHHTSWPTLWACKGFDSLTRRMPHEIAMQFLPSGVHFGALSGPSFALEVAQGLPAALTLASTDATFAHQTAAALSGATLRIYSSSDLIGVELGGALKNVMAIAAGISDGLELGNNARAALITRGLAEMVRLGVALGGKPETFMGLTGLGDLVLTATGNLSRNRKVGLHLAMGMPLVNILATLGHVAEGVNSAETARILARKHRVDMPITEAVCAILFEGADPRQTVKLLLAREARPEAI